MAVKTNYKIIPYDISKGQSSIEGRAQAQAMIPRRLVDLRYEGNSLVSRPSPTAFATGVYSASYDMGTGTTDGSLITDAVVTNICSDGARVFGQTTISIGQSNMPTPGLGSSSYVVELKDVGGAKTWCLTDIPAPRAATPVANVGPYACAAFNSGADSDLLLANWNADTGAAGTDSPDFFLVGSGQTPNDPQALKKTSVLSRFPNLGLVRAAGSGYTVCYDTVAGSYRLLKHSGQTIRSWLLLSTAGPTEASSIVWDALLIGDNLYLVTLGFGSDLYIYRYDMTAAATGSLTGTPTNLNASATSTIAASIDIRAVAISSQDSPTEFRMAWIHTTGAVTNTVTYARRNLLTLASIAAYSYSPAATSLDTLQRITCNGNIVIAEAVNTSGIATVNEFSVSSLSTYTYGIRKSAKLYAYVYDGAAALVEKPLFPNSGEAYTIPHTGQTKGALQTYLNSHISSSGRVAIGDCIYQVIEVPAESAGVQKVSVRFLAKAIDTPSNGALYGELNTDFSVPTVPRSARESNSLSRWVSDRYVLLPIGSSEVAPPVIDTSIASANGNRLSGISSNERSVVMDIAETQLTACEIRSGVTALGHGWSISSAGEIAPSCAVTRPLIDDATYLTASGATNSWVSGEVVAWRAVAVSSAGGIESYISSPTHSITVGGGDLNKSIQGTVLLNGQNPAVSKIRIYRSRSQLAGNEEFHFLTEIDPPTGATNSVTFIDSRMDLSARPIDPTFGGTTPQGNFVAGQRDVASIAGRAYVVTSDSMYPCQPQAGDDALPTPWPDAVVYVPSRHGKVKHVDGPYDSIVVSTEESVLGISGEALDFAGQGGQIPFTISEGTGCNGKPVATPAGLMVPRLRGILLVDRSRNAQDIMAPVSGDANGALVSLTGACAYSVESDEAIFGVTDERWLVLSAKAGRWTEWSRTTGGSMSIATCNRGSLNGLIALAKVGWTNSSTAAWKSPVIHLGWDSFPDRFHEAKVRRVLLDGYRTDNDGVIASMTSAYNLDPTASSAQTVTIPAYNSEGRNLQGFRVQVSPARRSGSSFRFAMTLSPVADGDGNFFPQKLYIDTIAVEVLDEVKHYSAGGE